MMLSLPTQRLIACYLLIAWCLVSSQSTPVYAADVVIQQVSPLAIAPGATTQLTITGTFGEGSPQFWNSLQLPIKLIESHKDRIVVEVTAAKELGCGPFGFCLASNEGCSNLVTLLVDDMPSIAESQNNHQLEQAQPISVGSAIDGTCEGTQLDYFQIACQAGETWNVEIVAQRIASTMDPVLRVIDPQGQTIRLLDDMTGSTDCQGSFTATVAGDYKLIVHDNRYAAGGAYRLRVGDFPLIQFTLPTFVSSQTKWVQPHGPDLKEVGTYTTLLPRFPTLGLGKPGTHGLAFLPIACKRQAGKASAWTRLGISDLPELVLNEVPLDTPTSWSLPIPCGISGCLELPKDRDRFTFEAMAGETIRLQAHTTSFGAPTQLRLVVRNAQGEIVGQSPIEDNEEWTMVVTPKASGLLQCEVFDLLLRGGADFAYHVDIRRGPSFEVEFKFEPTTRDRWSAELPKGGIGLDFTVKRSGYDGPIRFRLEDGGNDLQIANPDWPAGSKEGRLFLLTSALPSPSKLWSLRPVVDAVDASIELARPTIAINTLPFLRSKVPHQPYPYAFQLGTFFASTVAAQAPFFQLPDAMPHLTVRGAMLEQSCSIPMQRLVPEFKSPFHAFLTTSLPPGLTCTLNFENDALQCRLRRADAQVPWPDRIPLRIVAEHQNRTRWEGLELLVEVIPMPPPTILTLPDAGEPPAPPLPQVEPATQAEGMEP